ncbi:MAG: hypothetical protein KDE47_14725 [Caldilineaceae bacterium]|nr:hypothetical protein [Caldilineaceae bacterium]
MGQWLTKIEQRAGQISIRLRLILTVFCISPCYVNAEVLYAAPTSQPLVSSPLVVQTEQTVQAGVNSPTTLQTAMPIITPTPLNNSITPEPDPTSPATPRPSATPLASPTFTLTPPPTLLATSTPFVIPIGIHKGHKYKLYLPISYE